MNYKEKEPNQVIKKISDASSKLIKFNGDALGLLSLKLGNEDIAYKTLTKSRKIADEFEDNLEEKYQITLDNTLNLKEKMSKIYLNVNLDELKNKGEDIFKDIKNIDLRDIKESLVKTETRMYGDIEKFYEKKDIVDKTEDKTNGFVVKEVKWEKLD